MMNKSHFKSYSAVVPSRLLIRKVEARDVESLSDMIQSEIINFPYLPEAARISESCLYTPAVLKESHKLNSQVMLVAEQNGELVGFIHANITHNVAWLVWVIVPIKHGKQNRVWYMWRRLFLELRSVGVHKIWGAIRTNNKEAIEMARIIGFSLMSTAPEFWHGCDYILVSRGL